MERNYKLTKFACYTMNLAMSVIGNLSPLLFLTFRELYSLSFSLLGLLVLLNFSTQLAVDLILSFFSHKFNIKRIVKLTPAVAALGLVIYALAPILFPNNVFVGILIGTVITAMSGGLAEVLISPVIAAIPAKNPDREMSKLHSVYAWGVVGVVIFSTVFLLLFKNENWQLLAAVFALIPITSSILFTIAPLPEMEKSDKATGSAGLFKNPRLWLSVFAIFLGGAAECNMAQWASGYLETAIGLPKIYGDIFGVAMFAAMLGLGRSLFAKFGKSAPRVLFLSAIGATVCYITAAVSPIPIIGLIACALTGLCTAMLWPGNLLVASDRFPDGGVVIYALMASGGDLGASVAPQLVGIVADATIGNPRVAPLAATLGFTAEQLGMRFGILIGAIFPLIAIFVNYSFMKKRAADKRI